MVPVPWCGISVLTVDLIKFVEKIHAVDVGVCSLGCRIFQSITGMFEPTGDRTVNHFCLYEWNQPGK